MPMRYMSATCSSAQAARPKLGGANIPLIALLSATIADGPLELQLRGTATEHTGEFRLAELPRIMLPPPSTTCMTNGTTRTLAQTFAGNKELFDNVIAGWRARAWRNSTECQYLVRVILALKTNTGRQALIQVLAASVPSFLMPSSQEAFFGALEDPDVPISDNDLRESVVDFLVMWPQHHLATISDIRAEPQVLAVSAQLLPRNVTFCNWMERRMHRDIELREDRGWGPCIGIPGDRMTIHLTGTGRDIVVDKSIDRIGPGEPMNLYAWPISRCRQTCRCRCSSGQADHG